MDSKLTTGGPYVTDETVTRFKGYYRSGAGKYVAFNRSFVQFDGEGDTANARPRAIGGHPAAVLRVACLRKDPDSPYANKDGYVPFGTLVDYAAGRSNGCTSWSQSDAAKIIPMVKDKPTALYIYPKSTDIDGDRASGEGRPVAVARRPLLERLLLAADRRAEILAERKARADPREMEGGSSGTAAAAAADLQGAVKHSRASRGETTTFARALQHTPALPQGKRGNLKGAPREAPSRSKDLSSAGLMPRRRRAR